MGQGEGFDWLLGLRVVVKVDLGLRVSTEVRKVRGLSKQAKGFQICLLTNLSGSKEPIWGWFRLCLLGHWRLQTISSKT